MGEILRVMGGEEILQLRHWMDARADGYMIRDQVASYRGSIFPTLGLTLGEVIVRALHDALWARQYESLQEIEGLWMVDFVYRRVPRLCAMSRRMLRSWDSGFYCMGWQEHGRLACLEHVLRTLGPPMGDIQGSDMRVGWVLASSSAT